MNVRREPHADVLNAARQRLGQTVDGKYKLLSILGVGGMGIVYEAQHLFLGRAVALKVLHPRYEDAHDAALRFLREARALGTVGHRGIVQVLDAGFVDGTTPYLVMERLLGENLKDRIHRRAGLRIAQAAMALREIMKGLAAAHNKGIIHCDLKPENVFLSERRIERGSVKLLDFGIAQYAADASPPSDGEPAIYGTAEYMAPEQILAQDVDPRTDIYAAGAVIYEALSGSPPFSPDPPGTVFIRILRTQPAPLVGRREEIPTKFIDLVMSMLAKAPADRPSSTSDVVRVIDDAGLIPRQDLSSSGLLVAVKKS